MNKALLIVGHGSRSADAIKEFEQVVALTGQKSGYAMVAGAHMELALPDIPSVVKQIADAGITEVIVVPYFLFMGNHIKQDIPKILEDQKVLYPNISFRFAKPIGMEPLMADILIKRANEVDV